MRIATTRWGERPSWIASAAPGRRSWPSGRKTSGADAGHQHAQELGERHGHRRDRAGLDDGEQRPPVEEARERREPLAQEHVLAAGLGHHRRELGVGQRAGDRHGPGDDPDDQQRARSPLPTPAARCRRRR